MEGLLGHVVTCLNLKLLQGADNYEVEEQVEEQVEEGVQELSEHGRSRLQSPCVFPLKSSCYL